MIVESWQLCSHRLIWLRKWMLHKHLCSEPNNGPRAWTSRILWHFPMFQSYSFVIEVLTSNLQPRGHFNFMELLNSLWSTGSKKKRGARTMGLDSVLHRGTEGWTQSNINSINAITFFVGGSNGRFPLSYSVDCASSLMFMQGMASPSFPHPPQPPVSPDASVWFGTQTVPQDRVSHKQCWKCRPLRKATRGNGVFIAHSCLLYPLKYCVTKLGL